MKQLSLPQKLSRDFYALQRKSDIRTMQRLTVAAEKEMEIEEQRQTKAAIKSGKVIPETLSQINM